MKEKSGEIKEKGKRIRLEIGKVNYVQSNKYTCAAVSYLALVCDSFIKQNLV